MKQELWVAAQAGIPVLLWGEPGIGKTSHVMAAGRALGCHVEVVIASIREPADFAGLPVVANANWMSELAGAVAALPDVAAPQLPDWLVSVAKIFNGKTLVDAPVAAKVHLAPPSWAMRLVEAGGGIVFFDEVSTAPPAVQAAMLRVILELVVGDFQLPLRTMIIAAANPPEMAAGGWDLAPPMANRFCHIECRSDSAAWVNGMLRGWPDPQIPRLPDQWEAHLPTARALIASYIQKQPQKLIELPKGDNLKGKAWPSPRSWDMAARALAANTSIGGSDDAALTLVAGCVGEAATIEFLAYRKEMNLPNPLDLLRHPDRFEVPERGDVQYAVLNSVVAAAVNDLTNAHWLAAWKIMEKAAKAGIPDIAAATARALAQSRKADLTMPTQEIRTLLPLLTMAGLTGTR